MIGYVGGKKIDKSLTDMARGVAIGAWESFDPMNRRDRVSQGAAGDRSGVSVERGRVALEYMREGERFGRWC
jgi:hypothetical protein